MFLLQHPVYYYVPDDPAFGLYHESLATKLPCLKNMMHLLTMNNTKSTAKIIDKMINDNDDRIDEHEVLRARLLDMLVGDWDRHFDQFRWGTLDTGKGKLYYTIPRDRDQAYFNSDGFIACISPHLKCYLI